MTDKLVDAMSNMREDEALKTAREMLDGGDDPLKVLDACRKAMVIVGERFEKGEYFLPELMLSGEMLKDISNMAQAGLSQGNEIQRLGKVLIGTVEGDLHDIGKDIVTFMLDVNGFDVMDLGIDVPPGKFVDAIKEFQPAVVGLSGFLTLAFDSMKGTVDAIAAAGLRDQVKIMVGGGVIDEGIKTYTGADAYGTDAMAAVSLSKEWIGGE
ncbi:B12-binding domain-containing protein [Thermodesulfobacteriota bacterium]